METKPLPKSFMLVSMLGLAIFGVYTLSGRIDATWGFTLILISGIMFVASIISMTPSASEVKLQKKAEDIESKMLRKAPKKAKKKN